MPYSRKRKSTTIVRRPTYRGKRRRAPTRRNKYVSRAIAGGNQRFKWRVTTPMTSDASGRLLLGFNANGAVDNTVDVDACVISNNDVPVQLNVTGTGALLALYEQVRISGIKVQYVPSVPNEAAAAAFQPMYSSADRDGHDGPVTLSAFGTGSAIENPSFKIHNLQRPWTRYWRTTKYGLRNKTPAIVGGSSTAPDIAFSNQNIWGQWHDCSKSLFDTNAAHGSQLALVASGLLASTNYGTAIITLYTQYKDRQTL